MPYVPGPPSAPVVVRHQPEPRGQDPRAGSVGSSVAARHLTVVRGSRRHDVAVDPTLSVGEMLTDVLGDVPPAVFGGVPTGARWVAISLRGEVVNGGATVDRAGLIDGSVIVAVPPATFLSTNPTNPTNPGGESRGSGAIGGAGGGGRERRGRSGQQTLIGSTAVQVAGYVALVLLVVVPVVVGLHRTAVPPLGAAVLALALAAVTSRVVPDLVLRLSGSAASAASAASDAIDTASVHRWVRVVAKRQVDAHLAVLVVVLVASGVMLGATMGVPVSPRVVGPTLLSAFASAVVLAGSARGRSRPDRWILRVASATVAVPMVVVSAASMSTAAAVVAASACVMVGLVALAPVWKRRALRPGRPRLARGVDVLVVVAALPLACWAAGLLSGVQAWAHGVP